MVEVLDRVRVLLRPIVNQVNHVIGRGWERVCVWFSEISNKTSYGIEKINESLRVSWDGLREKSHLVSIRMRYRFIRNIWTLQRGAKWVWAQKQIDGKMARYGTLFLTFAILVSSISQPSGITTYKPSFPFLPIIDISTCVRLLLVTLTFIVMVAVLYLWSKYRLANIVKHLLVYIAMAVVFGLLTAIFWLVDPLVQMIPFHWTEILGVLFFILSALFILAVIFKWLSVLFIRIIEGKYQIYYWIIFWIVFVIGWLKGVATIPPGGMGSVIALIVGYVWFFVIAVIMLKSAWQIRGK
jgi:hypothetical protein